MHMYVPLYMYNMYTLVLHVRIICVRFVHAVPMRREALPSPPMRRGLTQTAEPHLTWLSVKDHALREDLSSGRRRKRKRREKRVRKAVEVRSLTEVTPGTRSMKMKIMVGC